MNPIVKYLALALGILLLGAGILWYQFKTTTAVPADLEDPYVHIPTGSSFEEVVSRLEAQGIVRNSFAFRQLSSYMNYERDSMRSGRFRIEPGMGMVSLIRHLRGGKQAPVQFVLNIERLPEEVAGRAGEYLEPDSLAFLQVFRDSSVMADLGYRFDTTLISLFIPNTYELYWNSTPQAFLERMAREHDAFWQNDGRREKAEALGMTPVEVYTLASIVERETLIPSEKATMAGVYLNRLRRGIPLQADPTAVFARRDFGTPRVTWYHTKFDSPYNTYMYPGLPPGPIGMASISSIDGVLNADDHAYLYFCAIGDGSGKHAFARTLAEHNRNAQRYYRNLRERGLR